MCITYFVKDCENIDYDPWSFNDMAHEPFRGPDQRELINNSKEGYIVFFGAAQTFGRYAKESFSEIYSKLSKIPCINLGRGGLSPGIAINLLNQSNELREIVKNARHVVIQITAPKNIGCKQEEKVIKHPGDRWSDPKNPDIKLFWVDFLVQYFIKKGEHAFHDLIEGMQQDYVDILEKLINFTGKDKTTLLNLHTGIKFDDVDKDIFNYKDIPINKRVNMYLNQQRYPSLIDGNILKKIEVLVNNTIHYDYSDNGSLIRYKIPKYLKKKEEEGSKRKITENPCFKNQYNYIINNPYFDQMDINTYCPNDEDHHSIAKKLYDNIKLS